MQPTGTLTFLFTDIAGSTQHWERDRAGISARLAEHDRLLRGAIEEQGGQVFKTVGDAFCATFMLVSSAVEAGCQAQATLADTLPDLRVRMALHSGQAEQRDGDYFGPTLNRVARLLAAGHGGQVLLSLATAELARDQLPAGTSLRDLGQHRLKDLARAEQIFQLLGPGLEDGFPPLATLDARPNNLPLQPTTLIGRGDELAQLSQLLVTPGVRLITLTDPGGTGKTRLALPLAAEALDHFPDGVFLVAITLLIFAISLYELFIGEINTPRWMVADSLNDLKVKLSSMMVLVMGIKFLEILMKGGIAQDLFWTGLAIALVSSVLIAFSYYGRKE